MSDLGTELGEELSNAVGNLLTSNSSDKSDKSSDSDLDLSSDPFLNDDIENLFKSPEKSSFCTRILREKFVLNLDLFDLILILSNLFILIFLLTKAKRARQVLKTSHSSVIAILYCITISCLFLNLLRILLDILFEQHLALGIIWYLLRFQFLLLEVAVMLLAMSVGPRPDLTRIFIKRVGYGALALITTLSLLRTFLNIFWPNRPKKKWDVLGSGDPLRQLLITSTLALAYMSVLVIPLFSGFVQSFLPRKRTFFDYIKLMMLIKILKMVGLGLLLSHGNEFGSCVVEIDDLLYLSLFPLLVYTLFLRAFINDNADHTLLFAYQQQEDDGDDFGGVEQASGPIVMSSAFNTANDDQEVNNVPNDRLVSIVGSN